MNNKFADLMLSSESDVEQKFIYPLLTKSEPDGLGFDPLDFWTKKDIRQFLIDKSGKKKLYYPDYAIVVDGLPCLIIEAKAPGADLTEAAREARLYANEINASYPHDINPCQWVIATDGFNILLFEWDASIARLVLSMTDVDSINEIFSEFLELISKRALQKSAGATLRLFRGSAKFYKPIHMLGGKMTINETIPDNSFGSNISIEYRYLFNPDSKEDRESVVRNAYVTSKRKQGHVAPIEKLIRGALHSEGSNISDTAKPHEIFEQVALSDRVKNEILLLVGSVGSGKSTFTDYLRLVALDQPYARNAEWVSLNLNKAPLSRELIYDWVMTEIMQGIESLHLDTDFYDIKFLKKIYANEINKVKRGRAALYPEDSEKYIDIIAGEIERMQSDRVRTLQLVIHHVCRIPGRLPIIVLDNCDKGNRGDQLLMFEVASWLKETFECMVFLPLRDTTYDQFKNEPPLDTVIKDLVFRIDPPLLEKVIYARLSFALRQIDVQNYKFSYRLANGVKIECTRLEVAQYLKSMVSTLFQDPLFRRIITGLAGRNIRKGLEILLDFCKSGYVAEEEIFKIRTTGGEYKFSNYLVMKILMKGKRRYYSDSSASIKNAFSSSEEDQIPDPFVRLDILQWLKDSYRIAGPNRTLGFHKVKTLIQHLQAHGHNERTVLSEILQLASAGCISAETRTADVTAEDLISISPAGFVHLDLVRNISYLSTASEDVLFRENQVAKSIAQNITGQGKYRSESRQAALNNSKHLVDYLCSYQQKHFPRNVAALNEGVGSNLYDFSNLQKFVDLSAENDPLLRSVAQIEQDYPPGSVAQAQISSVRDYGFFVDFGAYGRGLIHKSQLRPLGFAITDFEVGDWVSVQTIIYNESRKNFDLKLIPS